MNASFGQPFVRAASALRSCRDNMADAARWMHPSWPMALMNLDAAQCAQWSRAVDDASPAARERASFALCASAGADALSIEQLSQPMLLARADGTVPNPVLLDVCPAALGLQILRMRALSFRRAEARRLIDKRTRALLSGWAGVPVDQLCLDAHLAEAPNVAMLHSQIRMPVLASLDADALAVEGLLLIARDSGSRHITPCPLLRCALPRDLPMPAWLAKLSVEIDSMGTVRLFARLPALLPEWAWLFG
ncbi:type III secretion protein HrpB4 [Paraburkholderia phosphatilytica]|uniref:type III secretion protein HrpB4 n=1 Tax=Paraburkholderia phosphatilytica TaxID=2282883 RepID=UPI000E483160|nr:type III secretion protein HrpB4 [Paraburkholderia phosphatilytica]